MVKNMIHEMNLHDAPYKLIKEKTKTVEMRLNDERRKDLKIGDIIIFTNRDTKEKLKTKVLKLDYYDSFKELYKHFDNIEIGYKKDDIPNPSDMDVYYTKEQQEKYGVIAIRIELL